jgi:hypothetical protein
MSLLTWLFQNHFWPMWWLLLIYGLALCHMSTQVILIAQNWASKGSK